MDPLERDIRAANPLRSRRTSPLSPRAIHDLNTILSSAPIAEPKRPRYVKFGWVLGAAAVLALAAVITVTTLGFNPPASVAAPPLLTPRPLDESLEDVLEELSMHARAQPDDTSPAQTINYEQWAADITVANGETTYFVQPQEVRRERDSQLAGFVEVRAGTIRWGTPHEDDNPPTPGEVLDRFDYAAGTYPLLFAQAPPATADELRSYLASLYGFTDQTSTGEYFRSLQDLRNEWPIQGTRASAVLELAMQLPNVQLLGEVTDRLDRTGVAIATDTRGGGTFRDILVFDPVTGTLLSAEEVYLGGNPDVQLPTNSVITYIAWDC